MSQQPPPGPRVLFAASEAHPLIKTGGLADVAGALSAALRALGCDLRLVLPGYPQAMDAGRKLRRVASLPVAAAPAGVTLWSAEIDDRDLPVYLIDAPGLFDRPGNPYTDEQGLDWPDNAQRFAAFGRAIALLASRDTPLDWRPQIVHCNDWQTGLAPALIVGQRARPGLVFTIHNLSFAGAFDWSDFDLLDLPHSLWTPEAMEFYGQFAFIKGGLVYADQITTVSPTYAGEICTAEYGCGFEGLLEHRKEVLSGILNGVDYAQWSPEHDPHIAAHFSRDDLAGKQRCRQALLSECGLPGAEPAMLIGMVGRLTEQKGVDLVLQALPWLVEQPVRLALLGSGDRRLERALLDQAARYPDRIAVRIGYDEGFAHRVEAGADLFLMPSRFEPCGLNQIYSLRYGTLPLVRRTGGLADTVVDLDPTTLRSGTATGFSFEPPTVAALQECVTRALTLHRHQRVWRRMMHTAMSQDFGWQRSAQAYLDTYRHILESVVRA